MLGQRKGKFMRFKRCNRNSLSAKQFLELCNAVSMLPPSLLLCHRWLWPPVPHFWNHYMGVMAVGIVVHMFFSVNYHLQVAAEIVDDPLDNNARRLDQSFVHIAAICTSYAESASISFTVVAGLFNAWCILRLWGVVGGHDTRRHRTLGIILALLLYISPMLVRGDHTNFIGAFACFLAGLTFFAGSACFGLGAGWGHVLLHMMLWPFTHYLLASAAAVDALRPQSSGVTIP
mmetsp:Transcript_111186/g.313773  ORF Transcript_111186/g.313773 Transcript_111186/m.313773 type:complete len:232 (+) Transcript_111186:94-789(+)